jgi:type II secretory pathway component PulK
VALAIVVWFIAAMSLLVAGIVSQARVDTRLAQVHVAAAKAVAAGDGAINLFLAQYTADTPSETEGPVAGEVRVGDLQVTVEMVAAAGLIDLRSAGRGELEALFMLAAGADPARAQTMASNVVRLQPMLRGFGLRNRAEEQKPLSAIEDLLRVEGLNRAELDAIRDFVTVGGGSRRVDLSSAPAPVRAVLARGDEKDNDGDGPTRRRTRSGGEYRIDAFVRYGGQTWLRRRWVSFSGSEGQLPWRFFRTEAPRVITAG